jgi:hypothetical protein
VGRDTFGTKSRWQEHQCFIEEKKVEKSSNTGEDFLVSGV